MDINILSKRLGINPRAARTGHFTTQSSGDLRPPEAPALASTARRLGLLRHTHLHSAASVLIPVPLRPREALGANLCVRVRPHNLVRLRKLKPADRRRWSERDD